MKKIVFLFALFSFLMYGGPAFAQTAGSGEEGLDFGTSGILPTNPFYFLKEWRRDFRRLITRNPIRKAEVELTILNQQAAEINQLQELAPERIEALNEALERYRENVIRLRIQLREVSETSKNPNVDMFLEQLTDRVLLHEELFKTLEEKFLEQEELFGAIRETRNAANDALGEIPGRFETDEAFKIRLERLHEGDLPLRFRLMFATSTATSTLEATSTPAVVPEVKVEVKKPEPVKEVVKPKVTVPPPAPLPPPVPIPPPAPIVPVREVTIKIDDQGLHPAWLTVKKGEKVRLTFKVDINSSDYSGYFFVAEQGFGWDTTGRIFPNHAETVEFVADKSFEFTSKVFDGPTRGRGSVTVEE